MPAIVKPPLAHVLGTVCWPWMICFRDISKSIAKTDLPEKNTLLIGACCAYKTFPPAVLYYCNLSKNKSNL